MNKYTFFTIVLVGGAFIYLANQAAQGSIAAWVIIAAAVTIVLLLLGAMIHHAGAKLSIQREQANFDANVRENQGIMNAMLLGAMRSQKLVNQANNGYPAVPPANNGYPAVPPMLPQGDVMDGAFTIAGLDEEEVGNA